MTKACQEICFGPALTEWRTALQHGSLQPADLLETISQHEDDPAWITRLDETRLRPQLDFLETKLHQSGGNPEKLLLYGVPFAVKDNIDVAGWPTTAGCPEFSYIASTDATIVKRLRDAGAIVVGKTNLDQFATGLVGTRSPYGAVPNAFRSAYISGGSSSGSASVVARGIVPFALGTDTAGSGRIPAGMNNLIGLKPTRGRISTRGIVPACRTLDCASILALTTEDAQLIAEIAAGFDAADPYSRIQSGAAPAGMREKPRFGIPSHAEFFGDEESAVLYHHAIALARKLNVEIVPINFTPFLELAALLYEGPWVAERFTVVESLWRKNPEAIHPVVRGILEKAVEFTATDTFRAEYRRAELTRAIEQAMEPIDAMMVPTAPTVFTIDQVQADPVALNAKLGIYTNFVNFADMCSLALPAGMRGDGLPAGITLLASAWHDRALSDFGIRWQEQLSKDGWTLGATGHPYVPSKKQLTPVENTIRLAVVGAHLRGMPLNHQLTLRGAAFVEATKTAGEYRLYALAASIPPKPGLVRVTQGQEGAAIDVELWDVPQDNFGTFTAEVPPPLGIGNIILEDGRVVKGFICEPYGLDGAIDISTFGGWRSYLASL